MNEDLAVLINTLKLMPPAQLREALDAIATMQDELIINSLSALAAGCASVPIDKRVGKFVQLREARAASNKRSDKLDAAYKATLETIERSLIADAHAQGVTGFKTDHGTTYLEERVLASIADDTAFYDFVRESGDLDFFERRIKSTHVKEWMAASDGAVPPGLNIFRELTMKVRQK